MKIEELNESSLSRIQRKLQNHAAGAITAFRGNLTKKENMANNKKLLAYLMNKGYSVTKVKGSYIENLGSENEQEVGENSFFVVNDGSTGDDNGTLEQDLKYAGQKFDQDSILSIRYQEPAALIGTSDREDSFPGMNTKVEVGKPVFGDSEGEFFSRIGGRKFAFESEYHPPDTINGKRAMKKLAESL